MRILIAAFCFTACFPAGAQGYLTVNGRNHPEHDWKVAETEHFAIMYPAHLAGIENRAASVAEESYRVLSESFGGVSFDKKIRIYLSEEDEIANGSAFPIGSSGFTTIWVHANETAEIWTGDVKWLRKVIAHELAHLFHFKAIQTNLGLLQNIFAQPLPAAWTEGLAQYQTELWDSERGDRWLRTAVFEDRLRTSDGQSRWNGRLLYAIGNSQVRYIAEQYGDSTITNILEHRDDALLGLAKMHDFFSAFEDETGVGYNDFQEDWRKHLNVYYNTIAGQMERVDSLHTEHLDLPGQYVSEVAYSPDTTKIAAIVLSSLARPVTRLYVMNNVNTGEGVERDVRVLAEGAIAGSISWSSDGQHIVYTRKLRGEHGSLLNDLFVVDVESGSKTRLTENRRAVSPSFTPDGTKIAFAGTEIGTTNIFILDLNSGVERQLTHFEGDVQITSVSWSPRGDQIAATVFDAEGIRRLILVDPVSGEQYPISAGQDVPSHLRDDRDPVWRPDGGAVAYTSLHDGVPNVFVMELNKAEGPQSVVSQVEQQRTVNRDRVTDVDTLETEKPDAQQEQQGGYAESLIVRSEDDSLNVSNQPSALPREQRITYLYAGATVHDWLPPDSTHAEGRLVVVATETKRRERVYVIDASRRPTVDAETPLRIPTGYGEWSTHRPPQEIPHRIEPDSSLITERHDYNSLANITHAITLPLPYADPENDDYGFFANTIWLEPLGKHQLFALGGISVTQFVDKSFLLLEYINNTLSPRIGLTLYRFPSPSRFYGDALLVENLTGGDISATLPLDLTDAPFTTTEAGVRLRYAHADPYDLGDDVVLEAEGDMLELPEAGYRADMQLGFAWKRQRPYRYNVLNPLDGMGIRARVTVGAPVLGSTNEFVRPDLSGYWISPTLAIGRFYVYGRATAQFGSELAQDYVGLARFDDIDIQVPFVGSLTLDDSERVRGYRSYAVGNRAMFGSLEYRLAPAFDLQTTVLGMIEFDRLSFSLFSDAGMVWTDSNTSDAIQRLGVGAEASNLVRIGGFELRHAIGVATPWNELNENLVWDDVDLYYRIQAAVPF